MKKNQEELIDQYLNEELSDEQRLLFEEEMERDPALKEQVVATRRVIDALVCEQEKKAFEEIKQTSVDEIRRTIQAERRPRRAKKLFLPLFSGAAAVAVILLLCFRPYEYTTREILSDHLIPESLEVNYTRGDEGRFGDVSDSTATTEMITVIVMNHYRDHRIDSIYSLYKNYAQATLWHKLPEEVQTIVAYAMIRNNDYDAAASLLLLLDTEQVSSQTAWLKLIVLLDRDYRAGARSIAELLVKRDDGYKAAAEQVLRKLNKRVIL